MKSIRIYFWGLLVLTFSITACSNDSSGEDSPDETIQAEVITLSQRPSGSVSTFGGEVKSTSSINIATKVMGEVESVPFQIGESFRRGDIILQIKQDQILAQEAQANAALQEARVAFEQAEKDLKRFEELYKENSASLKELENAQNHMDASRLRAQMAEARIREIEDLKSYTAVRAPYNGVVSGKFMEEGDLASPGMPVLSIEQNNSFKFTFTVPEARINEISTGDTLLVSIPALSGSTLQSQVSRVNTSGNSVSRQFRVEATISESLTGLRSGMYGEAELRNRKMQQIVIPESAVVVRGQLRGVYTVNEDNTALLKWISLGQKTENGFVVLSGLRPGEKIVRDVTGSIYDGALIANN
ncbi:efflux RND transporter periplasmic adaptor subunit [Balneola sp. MJW-20]|uniref:efflux RND transporter periplasmic adaptor subunit n=1 Tax=Gracilimonas aurantiaca TaxID=3234185 RepID=UPI0034675879